MKSATLDSAKYGKLLAKARPHVLHNDAELQELTKILLELDELENPSREQQELAELLTTLIEQYESAQFRMRRATPTEMIQFLLEQRGLSAKDLWGVIGSKGNTPDILSGKHNIGVATATRLGEFFHVGPEVFIEWDSVATSSANLDN